MTDPERTPDVLALARCLPKTSGLILRHFGMPHLIDQAGELADITRTRAITFLIAQDEALALDVKADGVHWPEASRDPQSRRANWIQTTSAHSESALKNISDYDLVFLSPVFNSYSSSAGACLNLNQVSSWIKACPIPVYALGGVTTERFESLKELGFSGCAGVSAESPAD